MCACLKTQALPGPSTTLAPKPPFFESFFGREVQIITHFLSPDTNPNQVAPDPLPFGNATCGVLSIAAGCGPRRCILSPPAPTQVARTMAQLAAFCCSQLGRNRGQRAVPS